MKYDAIISGYVSMDRVIKIDGVARTCFTSIIKNKDNAKIYYGGCSTNISCLLAKLNKKALPVIRIGQDDLGQLGFYNYLNDIGVCLEATTIVRNETTSNCYLILDENKAHTTIFYPGAMDEKYAKSLDEKLFKSSRYAVLTVGSYKDNLEFLNNCKKTKTPLIFGMKSDFKSFPIELLKEILFYSEIIFTNEAEKSEIEKIYSLSSMTDLFETGNAKVIVTTLGKDGSVYFEKTKTGMNMDKIKAAEINPPIDTTGCGDAYIAGFIYGLVDGKSIKECCNYGSVLSSFIMEKVGSVTNAPDEEQFEERYVKLITEGV